MIPNCTRDFTKLHTFLPENILSAIRVIPIAIANHKTDKPMTSSGMFSVRSAFNIIAGGNNSGEDYDWFGG